MARIHSTWLLLSLVATTVYGSFNFIAIGDWGADPFGVQHDLDPDDADYFKDKPMETYGTADQRIVADRMDQWVAENGCDIIVSTGDNFYPNGLETMDDPRFEVSWRYMYNGTNIGDKHWYISLGNHDHFQGNEFHPINWTNFEPRWHLPYFWHDEYFTKEDYKIHLIALDTQILTFNKYNDTEDLNREVQKQWLTDTLANAEPSDWTIVYGHHTLHSCGRYSPGSPVLQNHIEQTLIDFDVDLYLDGHDHNLQHIVSNSSVGPEFIITGAGGRGRYEFSPIACDRMREEGFTLDFFAETYGFMGFEVTKDQIDVSVYSDQLVNGGQLELLHTFTVLPKASRR